ncbi:MAG: DUF721 domain-containing protein [Hyphomicrobiales bacterium]
MAAWTGVRRPRQIGRPLADLVAPALGKTLAARGFAAADVVIAWPEIVGERLAGVSEPISLEWPRTARKPGADEQKAAATLVMRVEGAFGLEAQHLAPFILERVNAYFGWRCANKLVIRQGRIAKKPEARPRPSPPDPQALAKGREIASGIADEKLRQAVARLGAQVLARK